MVRPPTQARPPRYYPLVHQPVRGTVLNNTRTRHCLAALYFLFYLPSGLLKGSLTSFLIDSGITLDQSGIIIGCMFFAKLALSPFIATAFDKTERKARYTCAIALIGAVGALAFIATSSFATLFAATLMVIVARNFFQSIMDSTAAHLGGHEKNRPGGFGSARFAGSISVSIGSMLMLATTIIRLDQRETFALMVAAFSMLYFVAMILSMNTDFEISGRSTSFKHDVTAKEYGASPRSRCFQSLLCLLSATLLIGTQGAIYSTGSVYLRVNGASESKIQLLWCVAFTSEAVAFYFSNIILNRLAGKVIPVILVAGIMRWLTLALFPSNVVFILPSFLIQGLIFALPQSYFVTAIHRVMDVRWSATVQTIYIGATQGIGISLLSVLTQLLYSNHGTLAWSLPCSATLLGCVAWYCQWRQARPNMAVDSLPEGR